MIPDPIDDSISTPYALIKLPAPKPESLAEAGGESPLESHHSENDGEREENIYEVEKIMDMSRDPATGEKLYLVRWQGFGSEDDTWEPLDNLSSCLSLIRRFERSHPLSSVGQPKSIVPISTSHPPRKKTDQLC